VKVEATLVDGRKVYSVQAFNQGISSYLERLPTVWVEGEVTELRRQQRWATVYLTLKDPSSGACLAVQMPRGQFDGLRLDLVDGERVHVYGRPQLYAQRGDFHLRALTIERYGLGAHLAALERLKQRLAAEGLFAADRKRTLPRIPSLIGLVTGNDAAAKRDVLTAITTRFPPARVLVAETYVQGGRAAPAIATAIADLCAHGADVVVLARGGGSFEDLLPFSDERVVRAVAACPVPVVSAVGHEQDTPLCDLAADVRASTPSVAGRLVVPDLAELRAWLDRAHTGLGRGARRVVERHDQRLTATRERLRRAPLLALERRTARLETLQARLRTLSPRSTLERGYAIVRAGDELVREPPAPGEALRVEVAGGSFGARSE
jgi:exodeoxyribonuclease VII large subunit